MLHTHKHSDHHNIFWITK